MTINLKSNLMPLTSTVGTKRIKIYTDLHTSSSGLFTMRTSPIIVVVSLALASMSCTTPEHNDQRLRKKQSLMF